VENTAQKVKHALLLMIAICAREIGTKYSLSWLKTTMRWSSIWHPIF